MPNLHERRIDAWTSLAAEPAVRAAERAIVTESATVLADTLAIATAAEAHRRVAHVLNLKDRADADAGRRDAYQRAADDLRNWAAGIYLATLRDAQVAHPLGRPSEPSRKPVLRHGNPYSEEGISLRRSARRPPFPGQRKRSPFVAHPPVSRRPDQLVADSGGHERATVAVGSGDQHARVPPPNGVHAPSFRRRRGGILQDETGSRREEWR